MDVKKVFIIVLLVGLLAVPTVQAGNRPLDILNNAYAFPEWIYHDSGSTMTYSESIYAGKATCADCGQETEVPF